MEQLLVQLLVALLAPHAQEDVATDELVDHLAVGREALEEEDEARNRRTTADLEDDILIILKLDHHVSRLPVDVPGLYEDYTSPTGGHQPPS